MDHSWSAGLHYWGKDSLALSSHLKVQASKGKIRCSAHLIKLSPSVLKDLLEKDASDRKYYIYIFCQEKLPIYPQCFCQPYILWFNMVLSLYWYFRVGELLGHDDVMPAHLGMPANLSRPMLSTQLLRLEVLLSSISILWEENPNIRRLTNQINVGSRLHHQEVHMTFPNDPTPHSPWPKVTLHLQWRLDPGNKGTAVSHICDWEHMLQQIIITVTLYFLIPIHSPVNGVLQVYSIIPAGTGETVREKYIIVSSLRLKQTKFAVSQLKLKPERALKTPGTCTSPATSSRTRVSDSLSMLKMAWSDIKGVVTESKITLGEVRLIIAKVGCRR